MKKAFVFPGQGSQKKGMGGNLFDEFPEITQKADSILNFSIKDLCLNDPDNALTQTENTQVALYVVNALSWLKKSENPDFLAGHSLGEYNALFASGAFDFETGLKLVRERGRIMAAAKNGGMAAVIGFDEDKIQNILTKNGFHNIWIANYNSQEQIVISGSKEEIEKANPVFKSANVKLYVPLKVGGAFHSPYMDQSAKEFEKFLQQFTFAGLSIPVISNVTGEPYKSDIKKLLVSQITSSVQWTKSVFYMIEQGVEEFEEIGGGKVLTGLIRQIKKKSIVNEKKKTCSVKN